MQFIEKGNHQTPFYIILSCKKGFLPEKGSFRQNNFYLKSLYNQLFRYFFSTLLNWV
jgi:hypothetical protein